MNERYFETRKKYNDTTNLISSLEKEIQGLTKQIEEFNELQAKVRQDPSDLTDEELEEYEKVCAEAQKKLPEIEKAQKEREEKREKYVAAIQEQKELYNQMRDAKKQARIDGEITDDELKELNENQEKINKEIEEKEKRKELLEEMVQNLQEQKQEIKEEISKLPPDISSEELSDTEIEKRIELAKKSNAIKKELEQKLEELSKLEPELADLYKQKEENEKLISKREKQVAKEEKKEAKQDAKLDAQVKEFDEMCESQELMQGRKLEKFLNLYNGIMSQLPEEKKKEMQDKYDARVSQNSKLSAQQDSKVKVKEPKVKTKEPQKVKPEKCTVAKGMLKTMKNFGTKFKNGIGKVVELGVSAAAAIYNGVTKSKQKIAELEAALAQEKEKNTNLEQENTELTQENANLAVENSEIKARKNVEINNLKQENKDLNEENEIQIKENKVISEQLMKEQKEREKLELERKMQVERIKKMSEQLKAIKSMMPTPEVQTETEGRKLG